MPKQQKLASSNQLVNGDRMFAVRLMEHLIVATFVLDAHCKVIVWNKACERLTGILAADVMQTSDHWRAFYTSQRPCLADLVVEGRFNEISSLYAHCPKYGWSDFGVSAENWCVAPNLGRKLYLGFDAGPIYDDTGTLIAVIETVRDLTSQKQAHDALEVLARHDGLTGLPNRRMFDDSLEQECRQSRRDGTPLSLLMIDIDHFKLFNDTAGHQAGDECLRQVAWLLKSEMLRPSDAAARYGGEEFGVILPQTTLDGALIVAERIINKVNQRAIPHPSPTSSGIVTISIGLAYSAGVESVEPSLLVQMADAALYRAKRNGRNRVAVGSFTGLPTPDYLFDDVEDEHSPLDNQPGLPRPVCCVA